jgi:NAD(P)-dependent dehydrogenase (short-subunit alcohol dehydrogenase family)
MAGRICDGRVAIVTGAGRGIGRAEALELARQGARVVVNDLGAEVDGSGQSLGPAGDVVEEIRGFGGEAVVNGDDVADWEGAQRLVNSAIETFGRLDVLVNNAGILRDRMLVNMTDDEWDSVIRVHLRGTFAPTRWAASYWRELVKAGETVDARVINTTSASGIYGNPGQANYGAAKAGIASFTVICSMELARYGITVNAIAPGALTRMTEGLPAIRAARAGSQSGSPDVPRDETAAVARSPENVAPLVAWLASAESAGITGRVFNVGGGRLSVAEGWVAGPGVERDGLFDTEELGAIVPGLVEAAASNADMRGRRPERP